ASYAVIVTVAHVLKPTAHVSLSNSFATSLPSVLVVTGHAEAGWNVPLGAALLPPTLIEPLLAVRDVVMLYSEYNIVSTCACVSELSRSWKLSTFVHPANAVSSV